MAPSYNCTRFSRALQTAFQTAGRRDVIVPSFLVPALAQHPLRLSRFSTSTRRRSKIGRAPLSLPPEVTFRVVESLERDGGNAISRIQQGPMVEIEGPLGKTQLSIPPFVSIEIDEESRTRTLSILDTNDKKQKAMWGESANLGRLDTLKLIGYSGTVRAYLQNNILGVSEGHAAILRLVGVGFRATVESSATTKAPEYPNQKFVSLKVGYSHPIELGVPKGVTASTPQPTRILLEGVDKRVVKQFAAEIRAWRKPEPYKGKGIFVNDETIKLKAKKIK